MDRRRGPRGKDGRDGSVQLRWHPGVAVRLILVGVTLGHQRRYTFLSLFFAADIRKFNSAPRCICSLYLKIYFEMSKNYDKTFRA